MEWEKLVYEANAKTFNLISGYNNQLTLDGQHYNDTLLKILQDTIEKWDKAGQPMFKLKTDFLAERAIPDNIEEQGTQNAGIVVVSYIMMFIYVSISIGFFPSAVHNRFILGLAGIFVVMASLVVAIGITCYGNIPLTMISAEVVPFLILAIGVDNMFLISRAERNVPSHITDMELRVAYAMKEIGPSIFAAAFCESLAFFIGMLTDVPALWSFCLVAGLAVVADFLL
jgi:Niemann-Pick C1 protein